MNRRTPGIAANRSRAGRRRSARTNRALVQQFTDGILMLLSCAAAQETPSNIISALQVRFRAPIRERRPLS